MNQKVDRNNVQKQLGARITKLRERKGLTQNLFADRCGLTQPQMKRIEDGEVDLSLNTMRIVAQELGTTISSLFHDLA